MSEEAAVAEPTSQEAATAAVQRLFDKSMPPPVEATPPTASAAPPEPQKPVAKEPAKEVAKVEPAKPVDEPKKKILPAFLQKGAESPVVPPAPPPTEEWPDELPGTKDAKAQADFKKWRTEYKTRGDKIEELTRANADLQAKTGQENPATTERIAALEKGNAELLGVVERFSLENSPRFQATFTQPRAQKVELAKGILKEVGLDPGEFDRLLSLQGKARFDAYETLAENLPSLAKDGIGRAIDAIQEIDLRKQQVLSDPKRSIEEIRRQEVVRQQEQIKTQQKELDQTMDSLIAEMRDVHKLEVLQRSPDPNDSWWNDKADRIEATAKSIARDPDPKRLLAAVVLGSAADDFREMFLAAMARADKAEAELAGVRNAAPDLSGEGGALPAANGADDTKRPFSDLFLDTLKKARNT